MLAAQEAKRNYEDYVSDLILKPELKLSGLGLDFLISGHAFA